MGVRVLRTYLHGSLLSTGARGAVLADILFAPASLSPVSGQQSAVMAGLQSASAGALAVAAASAITLGAMTGAAAGTVGFSAVSAESAITLDGMQAVAAGSVASAGQGAATLTALGSSAGVVATSGSGSSVLDVLAASGGSVSVAGTSAAAMGVQGAGVAAVAVSAASAGSFAPISSEATGSSQGVAVGAGAAIFDHMAGIAVGGALISGTSSAKLADLQSACAGACIGSGGADQHLGHLIASAGTVDLLGDGAAVLALDGESAGALAVEGASDVAFASLLASARAVVGAAELPPPPAFLKPQSFRQATDPARSTAAGMAPRLCIAAMPARSTTAAMSARNFIAKGEADMLSAKDPAEVIPVTFSFRQIITGDALESAAVTALDANDEPIIGALPSLPAIDKLKATQLVAGGTVGEPIKLECVGTFKSGAVVVIRASLPIALAQPVP